MFNNAKKHSRIEVWKQQSRAARHGSPGEIWQRRRGMLYRFLTALAAVLLISLIVHAGGGNWGPPFAFREGETYPRDIRVKVDFSIVDEPLTQLKREQAAEAIHPVLNHDPTPLHELQFRLTQLCLAARTGSYDRLDPEMIRFWSLSTDELRTLAALLGYRPEQATAAVLITPIPALGAGEMEAFAAIAFQRAQYPIESDRDLHSRLEAALSDLMQGGILEDVEPPLPEPLRQAARIIIRRNPTEPGKEVPIQTVLKSRLVGNPTGDKGPIFLQFSQALKNEKLAEYLYQLVVGNSKRSSHLPATLTFDPQATQLAKLEAQASVKAQEKTFKRGEPLIEQGKPITEQELPILKAEHKAYLQSLSFGQQFRRWLSLFLVLSMLALFIALYIRRFMPSLGRSLPRVMGVCALITLGLTMAVFFNQPPWYALLIPLTMIAMILTVAFDQPFALIVSFCMALAITLSLGTDLTRHFLVLVTGVTVAVLLLRNVRTRSQLAWVGFAVGLSYAFMTLAVGLFTEQSWWLISVDALRRFFWGLVAGLLVGGLLPFIERGFGIVTDMSLLELADVTHPLLQELIRRAPGTYTHSMTVALLSEAAARDIGANPLLTRVGACFHDIGKMLKPHYFVENQTGENRHEGLAPAMSTLIIIGHVKDGVELAEQHRLPRPIIDFIQQHHGTTLVEYFYREFTRSNENGCSGSGELEAAFRYPGPKPQIKEIGIVMLADAAEGASRALSEPAPSSLKKLVHDLLLKRLLDGQFDECGLTLSELHQIEESLCKNLIALYHARVKYPEAKTAV